MSGSDATPRDAVRRVVAYLVLLGLFLTFRGYRSREVDQAYRLPILLHQQDARLYADDPFVLAFDHFNPHRGYLALLDSSGRLLGMSAGLAALFGLTFLVTVSGVDRLASAVWCDQGDGTGVVAAGLVLVALAGNVGTNHLFEPILLDRLIAFGLGWMALAFAVGRGRWGVERSAAAVGLAGLVHPSVGLQLAMLLGSGWIAWRLIGGDREIKPATVVRALVLLAVAIGPGLALNLRESRLLVEGLAPGELRLLSAELQSPQHMLPHLWRFSQWLAWGCYPVLALVSWMTSEIEERATTPSARKRLVILLGLNLAGLAVAWFGIEQLHNLRLTLFQPFRMATVARGLCLVLVAGHVRRLWLVGGLTARLRATLIVVGLLGDWMLVVATAFEVTMAVGGVIVGRTKWPVWAVGLSVLAAGLVFLSKHDTESGHVPMLFAVVASVGFSRFPARSPRPSTPLRLSLRLAACWAVPLAALGANLIPGDAATTGRSWRAALVRRCRFAEVPIDDVERLGVWCRSHTPESARFIGPPGPKTFRLWSQRSLAFNRAGSPYIAEGLADWSRRFRDHVGYAGPNEAFVRDYLRDRHGMERRYDALPAVEKADLATRQGAGYVLASAPRGEDSKDDALTLLHAEGRFAVYRVNRPVRLAGRRLAQ